MISDEEQRLINIAVAAAPALNTEQQDLIRRHLHPQGRACTPLVEAPGRRQEAA